MPRSDQNIPRAPARRVLTVTQAAARDGVSRMTILRKLASGELHGWKLGNRWIVDGRDGQR